MTGRATRDTDSGCQRQDRHGEGDLVAQQRLDYQATVPEARHFAKLMAQRLCAGTDAC